MTYNVENYEIRVQSVYDRLLHLANTVFHLCISDELVNHSLIVSNLHVARTKVPKLLKAVRKVLDPRAQTRHNLIHKRSQRDPQLDRLALLYMHTRATWVDSPRYTFERLRQHRAQRLREITARLGREFRDLNDALAAAIEALFDELLLQYKRQKVRLERAI